MLRALIAFAIAATQGPALWADAASVPVPAAAGTPGVPQPPTVLLHEDFENTATTTPLLLTNYTGAQGQTYTADPEWLANCNGMIVNYSMTARPANCDAGPQGMRSLRSMAYVLGDLGRAANSATNNALSAYTDRGDDHAEDPGAGNTQLETEDPIALSGAGKHYLLTALDVSAVNCQNNPPRLQFSLLADGNVVPVGGEINPCVGGRTEVVTVPYQPLYPGENPPPPPATIEVHVGTFASSAAVPFVGSSVGIRLVNNEPSGFGNDAALDNIYLYDATPQLDKAFSPATVAAGQTATLTFTITNTNDLLAKPGWSFTDTLPAGMTVAAPAPTTTCTNTVVTPQAGGTSIAVTGDLNTNQPSCTVTVHVTAPAGHYVDGPANVAPNGVRPPADAEIDFVPVITLSKSGTLTDANGNGRPDPRETLQYAFVVTNPPSNGVSLSGVTVADPRVGPVSCPAGPLPAGQSMTCTATYTLTQADIDAGRIDNTATANASAPAGVTNPKPVTASASTPLAAEPTITVVKSAIPTSVAAVGDRVEYSFVVTNTGNVTLTDVSVTETAFTGTGSPRDITCPVRVLPAGDSTTCIATYTVTQADVDAGRVDNAATASGTPPSGPAVTSTPSTAVVTIPRTAALTVEKTAGAPVDADNDGRVDPGDTIVYTFVVANTGNVTLTNLAVADPTVGPVSCPDTTLPPKTSTTCTAMYTLTQANVNAGRVDNTATATASAPAGVTSPPPATGSASTTLQLAPDIAVAKSVVSGPVSAAGDQIEYRFLVTNTGSVTLTDVSVSDTSSGTGPAPVITCDPTTLQAHESTTCTATYTVTQADVNTGQVTNTARATGTPPAGPAVTSGPSSAVVTILAHAALTLAKTASQPADTNGNGLVDAGDTVLFTFVVENTGNVTLNPVVVTETLSSGTGTGPDISCPDTPLAPGIPMTCTATYALTQEDVDAGRVSNTAIASGTPPAGAPAETSNSSTAVVTIPANLGLTLEKSAGNPVDADGNGRVDAGDTVAYTFLVTNTGTVTLHDVAVDDPVVGTVSCPATPLAPHSPMTCTATYTLTQDDVDAGQVVNTARASGTSPSGTQVRSEPSPATVAVPRNAALSLTKTASLPGDANRNGRVDAGDTVSYTFLVTNTGNVTLTDVAIEDPVVGEVSCPATTLVPGTPMTCTATYTLTQGNVNAGTIDNQATATGTAPAGVTPPQPASDNTSTPLAAVPSITVGKSVEPTSAAAAGDQVEYSFLVTNTGNVTLTGIAVDDPVVGSISCPVRRLRPTKSTTCTATYTVTQADADAGQVANTATASGTPPSGPAVTSEPSSAVVTIARSAGLRLDKTAGEPVDTNGNGTVGAGDTILYQLLVTNTGNVTLTGVAITDPTVGPVTCPVTTVAPDAPITCTATYTLTQVDVDAGQVANTATATATAPPEVPPPTQASDFTTASIPAAPAITLVKTANRTGLTAGDTVTFTYSALNTGNVTLTDVHIDETEFVGTGTPSALSCDPLAPVTLAPDQALVCTATYRVTQADVDAGQIGNEATATGIPARGLAPTDTARVTVPHATHPALTLQKRATVRDTNQDGITGAGDRIAYQFVVTNTGDVTLSGIAVRDRLVAAAGIAVRCATTPLPPTESVTCRAGAPYVITAADAAAGVVRNTAVASGVDPVGDSVLSRPDTVRTPVAAPVVTPPGLPVTGEPVWRLAALALLLLIAGAALVTAAHTNRRVRG